MSDNLVEAILEEIDRVNELIKIYESIPTGGFGAAMLKVTLQDAKKALASGDVIQMTVACKQLQEIKE